MVLADGLAGSARDEVVRAHGHGGEHAPTRGPCLDRPGPGRERGVDRVLRRAHRDGLHDRAVDRDGDRDRCAVGDADGGLGRRGRTSRGRRRNGRGPAQAESATATAAVNPRTRRTASTPTRVRDQSVDAAVAFLQRQERAVSSTCALVRQAGAKTTLYPSALPVSGWPEAGRRCRPSPAGGADVASLKTSRVQPRAVRTGQGV